MSSAPQPLDFMEVVGTAFLGDEQGGGRFPDLREYLRGGGSPRIDGNYPFYITTK